MIRYPLFATIFEDFKRISGNHTGILDQSQIPIINHKNSAALKSITGNLPNYHKLFLGDESDIAYHIMGYGSHYEEAFIKYIGESVERYAGVATTKLCEDRIIYDSYKSLSIKHKVMPLEYLRVFDEEQINKNNSLNMTMCQKKVDEDDVIGWVECDALFKDEKIYVPAQMLFVGYKVNEKLGEKHFIPGFSTGTASHKSMKKALFNSLVEYIQIDSFMLSWHTTKKCDKIIIDDDNILEILEELNLGKNSRYEITVLDMSIESDMPLYTFGVILKDKFNEGPYITFGVQGGLDPRHTLLRGIMEAASITYGYYYNVIYSPELLDNVESDKPRFFDLDSNVLYYSHPHKCEEKSRIFSQLIGDEVKLSELKNKSINIDEDIKNLLNYISNISEYAVFANFTPTELDGTDWCVMRVLIPEMLEMCLPAFPFNNHPRMKKYGGVKNNAVHPMP